MRVLIHIDGREEPCVYRAVKEYDVMLHDTTSVLLTHYDGGETHRHNSNITRIETEPEDYIN